MSALKSYRAYVDRQIRDQGLWVGSQRAMAWWMLPFLIGVGINFLLKNGFGHLVFIDGAVFSLVGMLFTFFLIVFPVSLKIEREEALGDDS